MEPCPSVSSAGASNVRGSRMAQVPRRVRYQAGTLSSGAIRKAAQQRLTLPPKPTGDMPSMPEDVTELSDPELMRLFRGLQGWTKFLGTQLALAETDEKNATAKVASVRN